MALTPDGKVAAQAKAFEEDVVLFDTDTGQGDIHAQTKKKSPTLTALVTGHAGLRTQMQFQKALVGLSGGIDSARGRCHRR